VAPPDHPQCYALAFFGIDDRELAVQRRDTLKGLLLLGGFGFTAAVQRALAAGLTPEGSAAGMFDVPARALVAALAERIIPATDTPGAVEAGVVDFIEQIVFSWYTDAERAIFLQGLEDAGAMATTRFQQDFATLDGERQDQLLGELEQRALAVAKPAAFSLQPDLDEDLSPFFSKLKELVVVGYYTSEIGATRELRYERMPMVYRADVPLAEIGRAWANGMKD